ncbi:hydrophobin precursor [Biscogniauxia marginata]|nr:hydrophobin precursor [Biscogniauxia marginata]
MQFTILSISFLAAAVMANPVQRQAYVSCSPGLYSTPQCCATDVLGVADLDCATPPEVPTSAEDFEKVCATGGQRARCCVLPIAGQSILCQTPIGL